MDNTLLVALIGAIAGILGTYLAAVLKFRQDLKSEYDKDLRTHRIEAYRELWKHTRAFPGARYKRIHKVTQQDLQHLLANLHAWYFEQGYGLYLSKDSTDEYLAFKVALQDVLQPGELDETFEGSKQDEDLRAKAHALRMRLAQDVGTRVKLEGEDSNVSR